MHEPTPNMTHRRKLETENLKFFGNRNYMVFRIIRGLEQLSIMGVRRNFSRGNIKNLLILFRLLTMQCKWTFTKRFTLSTPLVCSG